ENAAGGLRVEEGDLRSPRAGPGLLVDDVKPRRPGVSHRLLDVGHPQGDVMQAGAAPRHELGDVALVDHLLISVGHAVFQDLEVGVAYPGEGRAQATIGILLLEAVDLEAELVAEDLDVLAEIRGGDADVIDAEDAHAQASGCIDAVSPCP